MKKITFLLLLLHAARITTAQFSNPEIERLFYAAIEKNDTLQLYSIRQQQTNIDIKNTRYSYLPRAGFNATYTRLNDDIIFPENLQTLLLGTQALLIKEKLGLGFNSALPPQVTLQQVSPIQQKNILKTTANAQVLLFSGGKIKNGIQAYQHQYNTYNYLSEKQKSKIWLDVAEVYDKLALLYASDAIITASEKILNEQTRFVDAAIKNGLATPLDRKKVELALQKMTLKKLENTTSKYILQKKMVQLTGISIQEITALRPTLIPAYAIDTTLTDERPELKALDEGIKATQYKRKAELAEYIPKVVAFGQYEFREKNLSLFDPRWFAGIRLQWNIFDGFTAKNNATKASLEQKALQIQKNTATELIALAKTKYTEDFMTATQKITLKKAAVQLTADTYDFINKQYHNGLTTLTELLSAITDWEKEKFELEQATYEQRKAALQLADLNGTLLK